MAWFCNKEMGEFCGGFYAGFQSTKQDLDAKKKISDSCSEETKRLIAENLRECEPVNNHLTRVGSKLTKRYLDKNDFVRSVVTLHTHSKLTKREVCIIALEAAAKCICSGSNVESIRAATYSYLARGYFK
jgi:hypothetical protein